MNNSLIKISNEVKFALKNNKPIVALESTLISHGLPYPENIHVANSCINVIRKNGSIPATIGIINGNIKVGRIPELWDGKTAQRITKIISKV